MDNQEIIFKQVKWSVEVEAGIKKACGWAFDFIKNEVITGACQCWHIVNYGYVVTRFEVEQKTLVLVAGQGREMLKILKIFEKIAKHNGCETIRLHSRRAGMVRFLKNKKYKIERLAGEVVFYGRV